MAAWKTTVRGTRAICTILAAVVSAHGDVLPDSSWDAAAQRIRWAIAVRNPARYALVLVPCASCQDIIGACARDHRAC